MRKTKRPIVFCFHDANESGATIWLRDFLLYGPVRKSRVLAILPADSEVAKALRRAGIKTLIVPLQSGDLMGGRGGFLALLRNRIRGFFSYLQLLRKARPALVYVNTYVQPIPMLASGLLGLRLVVHVHESWFTSRTYYVKRWVLRRYARRAIFAARTAVPMFFDAGEKQRARFSPNGVDKSLNAIRSRCFESKRQELGIEPGTKVFLFLGALNSQKGFHDLVSTWSAFRSRHPEVLLLVAGGLGNHEQNPAILRFVTDPPEGTRYLGFRKDAHELIAAADCLVLPSYGEAMPLSISEAMMIGTPVIARDVGDIAFQLGDDRGLRFRGDGAGPLRKALDTWMSWGTAERERRRANASDFASRWLDRSVQYRRIGRILRRVMRGS